MFIDSKVLAIIPARGGSKGIPRKNIKDINGKPLVQYTIDFSVNSSLIDRTIVSSDDEEILDICKKLGSEVIKRPKELAKDESPTEEAILHCIQTLKKENYEPDIILLLQPTSPIRSEEDVRKTLVPIMLGDFNAAMTISEVDAHYHPFWIKEIVDGEIVSPFGRNPEDERINEIKKYHQRQLLPGKFYWKNGSIYGFTTESFLRLGHRYGDKCAPVVVETNRAINIDSEDDISKLENYYKETHEKNNNM